LNNAVKILLARLQKSQHQQYASINDWHLLNGNSYYDCMMQKQSTQRNSRLI